MSKKIEITVNYGDRRNNYGCANFLLDAVMLVLTCGLWFFWILVRDTRR